MKTTVLVITAVVALACAASAQLSWYKIDYAFENGSDGANPLAGLAQGSDGNFYGTTYYGGTHGYGTVFRISSDGTLTTLYQFGSTTDDGQNPQAGLVQDSDGNFYGTTWQGGTHGYGTVFRISSDGTLTTLYQFGGGSDGSDPQAGLVQGSDGNFYGTTSMAGNTNLNGGLGYGTVFKITSQGTLTTLHLFGSTASDGQTPEAGLVQGSDGNFYGTTPYSGRYDNGTVFRISPSGSYTQLYSFGSSPNDGAYPEAGLVQGSDGNFYGTTSSGGAYDYGTVFRIGSAGTLTTLYLFGSGDSDGQYPQAGLVQGSDGNLYGTTSSGGAYDHGTVFRISTDGAFTTLYQFGSSDTDGQNPQAGLVQGIDGTFWGTTVNGGTHGYGTVFNFSVGLPPISPGPRVAMPTVTPLTGSVGDWVIVTMKCATPKATIHYTLDGSEPTLTSALYKKALKLTNSVTVTAEAFRSGYADSELETANYTITPPVITTPSALTVGVTGFYYDTALEATNGATPYKWSLARGSKLPPGLKLNRTGAITGTPTEVGNFTFTVTVTDAKKGTAQQLFTLTDLSGVPPDVSTASNAGQCDHSSTGQ